MTLKLLFQKQIVKQMQLQNFTVWECKSICDGPEKCHFQGELLKLLPFFLCFFFSTEIIFRVVLSPYFIYTGKVRIRTELSKSCEKYSRNRFDMGLTIRRMKGLNIPRALIVK